MTDTLNQPSYSLFDVALAYGEYINYLNGIDGIFSTKKLALEAFNEMEAKFLEIKQMANLASPAAVTVYGDRDPATEISNYAYQAFKAHLTKITISDSKETS